MATGPKLVHKQFNSPIGLYSRQNIEETLNKHVHHLENGATGIDFNDPSTGKPANLANSAVLRMLEEEERARHGYPKKKVVWPPVPETNGYHSQQQQSAPAYTIPVQHQQYTPQQQQYSSQKPQYSPLQQSSPQQQQYSPQQQQYPTQQQYQQQQFAPQPQSQPAFSEGRRQEPAAINRLIPVSSGVSPRPGPLSPQAPSQQAPRWNQQGPPQSSPNYQQPSYSPQQQYSAPPQQQFSPQQQQYAPQHQQFSPSQQQHTPQSQQQQFSPQPQYQPQPAFSPPPTTVTLRPHPPVHQRPPPVYASQPAAASFQGGTNMRGDLKWPPQSVKEAVAAENEARRLLAKGPACRPRRVNRDYTAFFAQNALNNTYPGYRVPPGTQHIVDHTLQTGTSSY